MAQLAPDFVRQFFDSAGNPLVGGMVYSYQAGTSTPLATFVDSTEATPNANPTILDANGMASIWLGSSAYKFVVKDSLGNTLETVDNVSIINPSSVITSKIADGAVTTPKLATQAVTTAQLADNSVTTAKIIDANVTTSKILDANVTTSKILDANVTTPKIADGAVTGPKLAAGAITDDKLSPLAKSISSWCQFYSAAATTIAPPVPPIVTNLSVGITTSGRNVKLSVVGYNQPTGVPFNLNSWGMWSVTSSVTNITSTVQAGTVTLFPTTVSQGAIFQAKNIFDTLFFTVTQASASGTYSYQYWNGTAWSTLTVFSTPSFTSTGAKTLGLTIPTDWVRGAGSSGADETMYSIKLLSTVVPATAVQISSLQFQSTSAPNAFAYHAVSSTSATPSPVQITTYAIMERSTSPTFTTVIPIGNFQWDTWGLMTTGNSLLGTIAHRDFDMTDDDGAGGLAAGTYYYRLCAYCLRAGGTATGGGFTWSGLGLKAEEVR